MQFKVGDRVEVVEPAEGLFSGEANNIGLGSVVRVDEHGCQLEIKVDDNNRAWWYELDKVRHPIVSKPTPTPSITVGTQVRLTGVVTGPTRKSDEAIGVQIDGATAPADMVFVVPTALEVIRQPFKRGEVVWHGTTELSVLADEEANTVLLVEPMAGAVAFGADANLFERRP